MVINEFTAMDITVTNLVQLAEWLFGFYPWTMVWILWGGLGPVAFRYNRCNHFWPSPTVSVDITSWVVKISGSIGFRVHGMLSIGKPVSRSPVTICSTHRLNFRLWHTVPFSRSTRLTLYLLYFLPVIFDHFGPLPFTSSCNRTTTARYINSLL